MISLLFITTACGTTKQIPITNFEKDTVIIKELVRDTVVIPQIQKEYIEVTTRDTISVLNTELATSTAKITNNQLFHNLEQKPSKTPVKIQYKDKIVEKVKTEYKEIPVEVIVEKPYIPTWCWIVICYAVLMAGISIVKIVYKIKGR